MTGRSLRSACRLQCPLPSGAFVGRCSWSLLPPAASFGCWSPSGRSCRFLGCSGPLLLCHTQAARGPAPVRSGSGPTLFSRPAVCAALTWLRLFQVPLLSLWRQAWTGPLPHFVSVQFFCVGATLPLVTCGQPCFSRQIFV